MMGRALPVVANLAQSAGGALQSGNRVEPGRLPSDVPACYPFCDQQTYTFKDSNGVEHTVDVWQNLTPEDKDAINAYVNAEKINKEAVGMISDNVAVKCDSVICTMIFNKKFVEWFDYNEKIIGTLYATGTGGLCTWVTAASAATGPGAVGVGVACAGGAALSYAVLSQEIGRAAKQGGCLALKAIVAPVPAPIGAFVDKSPLCMG